MRRPAKLDLAAGRRHQADDGFQRRRFAGAVAAEQGHDFAGRDLERHVEQDVRAAVKGVQALDREHHAAASASAEIDALHIRVGAHLVGRAVGDELAAVEHHDAVGMAEDHVHVVLGEQHADVRARARARRRAPSARCAPWAPCRRWARPSAAASAGWRAPRPARRASGRHRRARRRRARPGRHADALEQRIASASKARAGRDQQRARLAGDG